MSLNVQVPCRHCGKMNDPAVFCSSEECRERVEAAQRELLGLISEAARRHPHTRVILLHGGQGAGKDSIANVLVERYGFTRIGFADRLREICLTANPIVTYRVDHQLMDQLHDITTSLPVTFHPVRLAEVVGKFGWDEAKRRYPEVRKVQQVMGTEVFRDMVSYDFWVDWVLDQIRAHPGDYVIPDLRFPNEYDGVNEGLYLRHPADVAVWWVKRPNNPHRQAANHASEAWHPDEGTYTEIVNDGTLDDLATEVGSILAEQLGFEATINDSEEELAL